MKHETRTGLVNIVITINPAKMKIADMSAQSEIPLIKVRTAIPMVKMVKIEGNKIDDMLIFEL